MVERWTGSDGINRNSVLCGAQFSQTPSRSDLPIQEVSYDDLHGGADEMETRGKGVGTFQQPLYPPVRAA